MSHLLLASRRALLEGPVSAAEDLVDGVMEEMLLGPGTLRSVQAPGVPGVTLHYGTLEAEQRGRQVVFRGYLGLGGRLQLLCLAVGTDDGLHLQGGRPEDNVEIAVDEDTFPWVERRPSEDSNHLYFLPRAGGEPVCLVGAHRALLNGFAAAFALRGRFFLPFSLRTEDLLEQSKGLTASADGVWRRVPGNDEVRPSGATPVRLLLSADRPGEFGAPLGLNSQEIPRLALAEVSAGPCGYVDSDGVLFEPDADDGDVQLSPVPDQVRALHPPIRFTFKGQETALDAHATFVDLFEALVSDRSAWEYDTGSFAFRTVLLVAGELPEKEKPQHRLLVHHPAVLTALQRDSGRVEVREFEVSTAVRPARIAAELVDSAGRQSRQMVQLAWEPGKGATVSFPLSPELAPLAMVPEEWDVNRLKLTEKAAGTAPYREVQLEVPEARRGWWEEQIKECFRSGERRRDSDPLASELESIQGLAPPHKDNVEKVAAIMAPLPAAAVHFVALEGATYRMVSGQSDAAPAVGPKSDFPDWESFSAADEVYAAEAGGTLTLYKRGADGRRVTLFAGMGSWRALLDAVGRFAVSLKGYEDPEATRDLLLPAAGNVWLYTHEPGDLDADLPYRATSRVRLMRYHSPSGGTLVCFELQDGTEAFAPVRFADFAAGPAFMERGIPAGGVPFSSVALVTPSGTPLLCLAHQNDAATLVYAVNQVADPGMRAVRGAAHAPIRLEIEAREKLRLARSRTLLDVSERALDLLGSDAIGAADREELERFVRSWHECLLGLLKTDIRAEAFPLGDPDQQLQHVRDSRRVYEELQKVQDGRPLPDGQQVLRIVHHFATDKFGRGKQLLEEAVLRLEAGTGLDFRRVWSKVDALIPKVKSATPAGRELSALAHAVLHDGSVPAALEADARKALGALSQQDERVHRRILRYLEQRAPGHLLRTDEWQAFVSGGGFDPDAVGGCTDRAAGCVEAPAPESFFALNQMLENSPDMLLVTFRDGPRVTSRILRLSGQGAAELGSEQRHATLRGYLDAARPTQVAVHSQVDPRSCAPTAAVAGPATMRRRLRERFPQLTVRAEREAQESVPVGSYYLVMASDRSVFDVELFLKFEERRPMWSARCELGAGGYQLTVETAAGGALDVGFSDDQTLDVAVRALLSAMGRDPAAATHRREAAGSSVFFEALRS